MEFIRADKTILPSACGCWVYMTLWAAVWPMTIRVENLFGILLDGTEEMYDLHKTFV